MASSSSAGGGRWGKETWSQRSAKLEADRKDAANEWTSLNQRFSWKGFFLQVVMAIYKVWNLSSHLAIRQSWKEVREQLEEQAAELTIQAYTAGQINCIRQFSEGDIRVLVAGREAALAQRTTNFHCFPTERQAAGG